MVFVNQIGKILHEDVHEVRRCLSGTCSGAEAFVCLCRCWEPLTKISVTRSCSYGNCRPTANEANVRSLRQLRCSYAVTAQLAFVRVVGQQDCNFPMGDYALRAFLKCVVIVARFTILKNNSTPSSHKRWLGA